MNDEDPTESASAEPEVETGPGPDRPTPAGADAAGADRSDLLLPAPGLGGRRRPTGRRSPAPATGEVETPSGQQPDLDAAAPAQPTPGDGETESAAADRDRPASQDQPDAGRRPALGQDAPGRPAAAVAESDPPAAEAVRGARDAGPADDGAVQDAAPGDAAVTDAAVTDAAITDPAITDPAGGDPVASEQAGGERPGRWVGVSRAALLIGVLCGLLGFALAVQVRSNNASNGLASARQEDLVRILDDLSSREERLRRQIASLEAARSRLTTTGDRNSAALVEARSRSAALGVLAGTVAAQGPGIQLTMTDPQHRLRAEDLLDAIEELRAAGAEAIQIGPVRIGLDSSFTDDAAAGAPAGIQADGSRLTAPFEVLAIGDPATLATALNIPGGVVDTVRQAGGQAAIVQQPRLVIRALRSLSTPHYAQPAE